MKSRPQVAEGLLRQALRDQGVRQIRAIPGINLRILELPESRTPSTIEALKHNPLIEFVEPDYLVEPALVPNDTYYRNAWHLPKIGLPEAWDLTTGSSSIVIAIIDSGIDPMHADLAPNLVSGWNFFDKNSDTRDAGGHGTVVAGQAGAIGNNGTGVAAPSWHCRLMPLRVTDINGYGVVSLMAEALVYAADQGLRVANISFRASRYEAVAIAAGYFQSRGGVVTTAAGNESTVSDMNRSPALLTISATDSSDSLASFSNTGSNIDLSAPGVNILTTLSSGSYGSGSGTSASAPIVAGVAALVLSVNPYLTGPQLRELLLQSVDDLGEPGWDPKFGTGRINAHKAVLAAMNAGQTPDTMAPIPGFVSPEAGSILNGTASLEIAATDDIGVTRVEWYIEGNLQGSSTISPALFSWDTTTVANGSYAIQARAADAAGNIGSTTITVQVGNPVPDTAAPSVQVTSPGSGTTLSGNTTVNITATDNIGITKIEWHLNGALRGSSASSPALFSWNTTMVANGSYQIQARAADAAGNIGSTTITVQVGNPLPDTTPPVVQVTAPASGVTVSGTVQVGVSATDNVGVARVEWLLNGAVVASAAVGTASFSWDTTSVADGAHTLQAKAYDAAGNAGVSPGVTVHVKNAVPDTIAPTASITSPAAGVKLAKSTTVTIAAGDNVGVVAVSLYVDGKHYATSKLANPSFNWNTGKLKPGAHTLQATARDAAGNTGRSVVVTVNK